VVVVVVVELVKKWDWGAVGEGCGEEGRKKEGKECKRN
jgi:phenylpyruvate tautomerase PptA (4-oxalocrotonate tautomerase family)